MQGRVDDSFKFQIPSSKYKSDENEHAQPHN